MRRPSARADNVHPQLFFVCIPASYGFIGVSPADAAYLPDPNLTPGDALDVTASGICVPGHASKVRDVPASVKNQVYRESCVTKTHHITSPRSEFRP